MTVAAGAAVGDVLGVAVGEAEAPSLYVCSYHVCGNDGSAEAWHLIPAS